ncbi:unnamed protein product [marine sediment metagenome]|uniref:Uncharacterized protein n=1 Tax=marine sediment metagenome TaxID=412755 RepID=X1KYB8_9ZZZZ
MLDAIIKKLTGTLDPAFEQCGGLANIAVDSIGWSAHAVTFPQAFASIPNWLLTSVKRARHMASALCQPSSLKVFLYPCNITTTGFTLNVDVNAACTYASSYIDVSWLARSIPEAWVS